MDREIAEDEIALDPLILSVDTRVIAESNGVANVTVRSPEGPVTRSRSIVLRFDGSATEGTDYRVSSTELRFNEGENKVSTEIIAISDQLIEGRESIIITAIEIYPEEGIRGRELVGSPQTLTIVDDDMATWSLSVAPDIHRGR